MSPIKKYIIFACASLLTLGSIGNTHPQLSPRFNRSDLKKISWKKPYPTVLGVIETLYRLVPALKSQMNTAIEADSCLEVRQNAASILGANDPLQMQANEERPGPLFFSYFEKCADRVVQLGFETPSLAKANAELILGSDLAKMLGYTDWSKIEFSKISNDLKTKLTQRIIYFTLGPEDVARDQEYLGTDTAFGVPLNNYAELGEFLTQHLTNEFPNDSLLKFYTRLVTNLRLGPALESEKMQTDHTTRSL